VVNYFFSLIEAQCNSIWLSLWKLRSQIENSSWISHEGRAVLNAGNILSNRVKAESRCGYKEKGDRVPTLKWCRKGRISIIK
jgi:hypothetical protein